MKHEWRKHEKACYTAAQEPALVHIPAQHFLLLPGRGDPNGPDFAARVGALYALAYAVRAEYKKAAAAGQALPGGLADYAVYPLESAWAAAGDGPLDKAALAYTLMIRQPDGTPAAWVQAAQARVRARGKAPAPLLEQVRFEALPGGRYVQILHIGPFDTEPAAFARMDRYAAENGLARAEPGHRELYLNSACRTQPARQRTILRYRVG